MQSSVAGWKKPLPLRAEDLQRKRYLGKTIGIKLRYDDFRIATRALTLPAATDDAAEIRRAAGQCLKRVPLERKLRLLGVRAGGLCRADAAQAAQDEPAEAAPEGTLPLF